MMTRFLFVMMVSCVCAAQTVEQPSRSVTDPGIVTTRQAITPAGVPSVFQGRVFGVAWAGDSGDLWVLHATEVYRLDWKNNRVVTRTPHTGTPGNQAIFTDPATGDAVVGQSTREAQGGVMAGLSVAHAGSLRPLARGLGRFQPGALSVSAEADSHGHRYVAVPLVWENKLALVDAGERRSDASDRDGHRAFRGGNRPQGFDGVGEQSGRTSSQAGRTVRLADAEARPNGGGGQPRCRIHRRGNPHGSGDREGDAYARRGTAPDRAGARRSRAGGSTWPTATATVFR